VFRTSRARRWTSLFVVLAFVLQLAAPGICAAAEHERWDKALLTKLANRVHVILQKVCDKVSEAPGNDVRLKTFLCDERHRVFADLAGTVTITFPLLTDGIRKKFEAAVGSCLSTNGSLAVDFAVKSFEKVADKTYRIEFAADLVITLQEVVRETLVRAADIVGAVTVGALLSKFVNFLEAVDAEALGEAIKSATMTLWALGAGKIGVDAYDSLDRTGHVEIKELLLKTFTLRSLVYHFGVFILKAGVAAGATLTKLSFGAALGASIAGNIGVFVGAALAVAAVSILGNIIVTKLTIDMPTWWRFRKLRTYHERLATATDDADRERLYADIDKVENFCVEFIDDEIALDRYTIFDKLVERLGKEHSNGTLAPFEGVIEKLREKLLIPAVHDDNWNAARKWYQLQKAIGRLPAAAVEPSAR